MKFCQRHFLSIKQNKNPGTLSLREDDVMDVVPIFHYHDSAVTMIRIKELVGY